jgi:ABC-type lipoprotein export system ATPase subunit
LSAQSDIVLEAREVSRKYGSETILSDVSLQVRAGEVTTIVGPSGSGKTTLLALLALLLEPSAGEVWIGGRKATGLSDSQRSRLRNTFFGFIFQSAQLVGSLSVLDNVLLPAILAGRTREKSGAARELLERLGLGPRATFLPHQLSLGQKRRVAIARALLLRPSVILADEPTNDLDARRASQVADFLLALPSEGYALVLVTHDSALAERAGNRFEIHEGTLTSPEHVPASSLEHHGNRALRRVNSNGAT